MAYELRGYYRSSCSWRVRIALAWKGLEYTTTPVHLVKDGGEQHGEVHRGLNPMRELPVLLVDGQPLAQSVAILEYLEEAHPTPALLPADLVERARARQMTEIINSGIQPIQNLRVMQELGRRYELDKPEQLAWSREWITRGFQALETLAIRFGGRYSCGDQVSFADVCLMPQLYNGRRFKVDMQEFPTLLRVEEALNELDAFVVSRPEHQVDAPEN